MKKFYNLQDIPYLKAVEAAIHDNNISLDSSKSSKLIFGINDDNSK